MKARVVVRSLAEHSNRWVTLDVLGLAEEAVGDTIYRAQPDVLMAVLSLQNSSGMLPHRM
eukprot:scaffold630_cov399-Prasinococcus_capsulatus_cf.AAC.28